jgi:hypothetical protein
MHFSRYAAFFRPEQLDTLAAAFDATWQELTASEFDLCREDEVASLKEKLARRILVSVTAGGARDIETIKQQVMRSLVAHLRSGERICAPESG